MDRNTSIGILLGVGIVVVLAFGLAMFPAQSEDTIILVNKNGNDPVNSCAPNNGLILAQNLTDLCDVVIVSPSTSQLLRYNGSFWVNVNTSVVFNDTTTCNNIGTGSAFVCVEGSNVDLRSLLAGTGISISNNTNTITITNTLPEITLCLNQTTGEGLCIDNSIELKNLLAGSSISLSSNATHITITNTAPDNTVCANLGSGTQVYKNGECNFRTIVGSADISVTNTTNTVVIDFNGTIVNTVTSNSNSTIGVVPTTGNVVLYPKYELLCQTTLVNSNTTITCDNFSARNNLMIKIYANATGGTLVPSFQFNGDTGNNYSYRRSDNNGATSTTVSTSRITYATSTSFPTYLSLNCYNLSVMEKICEFQNIGQTTNGAGNAPNTNDGSGKWTNITNQITSIWAINQGGTGNFGIGSKITVWGYN